MKTTLPGWKHRPGNHCASTAISDAMNYHGHALSEPLCFGLGSGLGFAYFESDGLSPTRMTATRSRSLEPRFFHNLGRDFDWITFKDPDRALASAKRQIDLGNPVLLRADLAYLRYYNSNTHFAGHVIVMCGYDDEKKVGIVADTQWPDLQEVPYADLEKARYGGSGSLKNTGEHYPIEKGEPIKDLTGPVKKALVKQANDLIDGEGTSGDFFGLRAMEKAAASMPEWEKARDWQWCARWLYQVIEKRGTGGGAFRLMYGDFLEEIQDLDPAFKRAAPSAPMRKIARGWTELAYLLKEISERDEPRGFGRAASELAELARKERDFFERLLVNLE